jgi:hypothetical protein
LSAGRAWLCDRPRRAPVIAVVVWHDTGRLVWTAAGRDRRTVDAFLDALDEERCKQIESVVGRHGSVGRRPDLGALPAGRVVPGSARRDAGDRRAGRDPPQGRNEARRAVGFHSPDALIALAMLTLADLCLSLPTADGNVRRPHEAPLPS